MFDSKLTWVSYIYKLVWFPESFLEFPTDFIFGKSSEELCFLHKMKSKDGSIRVFIPPAPSLQQHWGPMKQQVPSLSSGPCHILPPPAPFNLGLVINSVTHLRGLHSPSTLLSSLYMVPWLNSPQTAQFECVISCWDPKWHEETIYGTGKQVGNKRKSMETVK